MPDLTIQLGLSAGDDLTFGTLFDRAAARLELLRSGRKELAFLSEAETLRAAKLLVSDKGKFAMAVPIPVEPTADMFGHPADRRRRRADPILLRGDAEQQGATDRASIALRANETLGEEVAKVMNTAADPQSSTAEIQIVESSPTVTSPASNSASKCGASNRPLNTSSRSSSDSQAAQGLM